MKIMCISDIHGNIECLEKAIEKFEEEDAEKLIILGDFSSYYFSSSDFEVAEILNNMAGSIIAVKGNCDNSEIDGIFNFGLTYIRNITVNNVKITLTHGHIYNRNNLDLPIYFIAGNDDPVIKSKKDFNEAINFLEKIGYHNIDNTLYDDMSHEILNEVNNNLVYDDILNWLNKII